MTSKVVLLAINDNAPTFGRPLLRFIYKAEGQRRKQYHRARPVMVQWTRRLEQSVLSVNSLSVDTVSALPPRDPFTFSHITITAIFTLFFTRVRCFCNE